MKFRLPGSLKVHLIVLFVVLALVSTAIFMTGMRNSFRFGWRDLARPLVFDYVNRLVSDLGSPPSVEKAEALTRRLPVNLKISGPSVNWQSDSWRDPGPGHERPHRRGRRDPDDGYFAEFRPNDEGRPPPFQRLTPDGHRIEFGLNFSPLEHRSQNVVWLTLGLLLSLTGFTYWYLRRLLRPLDDIRIGTKRFGSGDFAQPISVRSNNELGVLAGDINAMASDLQAMLDAKRQLLLALSHELRSPLTRARLNAELLPDTKEGQAQRDALISDLGQMRDLIQDLLESERLSAKHTALNLELTNLGTLAQDAVASVQGSGSVRLEIDPDLPQLPLDSVRIKLMISNLLDNALRHAQDAKQPPTVTITRVDEHQVKICVRDFGAGVPADQLDRLAEPFYRTDSARGRSTGGVGLGLYLTKQIALAHGATWTAHNANPGLAVEVVIQY